MKPSLLAAAASLTLLAACSSSTSSSSSTPPAADVPMAASTHQRIMTPSVPSADAQALAEGNTAFAGDLYQTLRTDPDFAGKNLFFSPYSISLALAMTYAGARGNTATEIASALHYTLPQAQLHPAFDQLDLALASRGQGAKAQDGGGFRLRVANSMWGAPQTTFVPGFLDTIADDYGSGVRLTDFAKDPEAARQTINGWVDTSTEDKIKELLPQGTISAYTRFVLVNAIYFNAAWQSKFDKNATKPGTFHGASGDVSAQMMHNASETGYAAGDGYQAVSLGYDGGDLSFVAIVPDDIAKFEPGFDAAKAKAIAGAMTTAEVDLEMPKFEIKGSSFSLATALKARGMKDAFSDVAADFSGLAATEKLCISDVIHQAFINVDENGTEAAAATAVIGVGTALPSKQVKMTMDKPFLFFIRDNATGSILFLGRVLNP